MKTYPLFFGLWLFFGQLAFAEVQTGDLIFHTSRSSQSRALQLAMRSPYSHMGIVIFKENKPYVFEASNKVKFTPLKEWIARGVDQVYKVKRLRDESLLSPASRNKLQKIAKEYEGRPYDLYFEWSDEKIYCSELVWKIYQRALGLQIGGFQTIGDFDLSRPEVKAKLRERFGDNIPLSEKVISPAAMYDSELLKEIR